MWDATEVKVSELKGTALDWAVALFNGECIQPISGVGSIRFKYGFRRKNTRGGMDSFVFRKEFDEWKKKCGGSPIDRYQKIWEPTTNGSQAQQIIQTRRISVVWNGEIWIGSRYSHDYDNYYNQITGETNLIAAMRCFISLAGRYTIHVPTDLIDQ